MPALKYDQEWLKRFVVKWQASSNVSDVANTMEVSNASASNIAVRLRKEGVPLKMMKGYLSNINFVELANIIDDVKPNDV